MALAAQNRKVSDSGCGQHRRSSRTLPAWQQTWPRTGPGGDLLQQRAKRFTFWPAQMPSRTALVSMWPPHETLTSTPSRPNGAIPKAISALDGSRARAFVTRPVQQAAGMHESPPPFPRIRCRHKRKERERLSVGIAGRELARGQSHLIGGGEERPSGAYGQSGRPLGPSLLSAPSRLCSVWQSHPLPSAAPDCLQLS